MLAMVSLLYFLVVFNHKAESPTFIIPMVGFGVHQSLFASKKVRWSLIGFTLFMVSVMYSDIVPRDFKHSIANVYSFKVWPFIVLMPLALWEIAKGRKRILAS